jgi:hypothetical protein
VTVADLEIPTRLPVDHFSASSIGTYLKCPESWRRKYIEREYDRPSGAMVLGSSVGAAENHADQLVIDGEERPSTDDVLDLFTDEFDDRTEREEVAWAGETPGEAKDTGIAAVKAYERLVVPTIKPVSVEREFWLNFDGVEWGFQGFFDLEQEDDTLADRKVIGKKLGQADADGDIQPTSYFLARRSEGNPAKRFDFHTMVKTKQPYAEVVKTERTDAQLDHFVDRLYRISAEILWRLETDNWAGAAPRSWWCTQKYCGFWGSCPMGGAR